MMGGSESLRDLQESRSIGADVFEFPLVESIFSFKKILNALQKVFADDLAILSNKLIFINICTFDGLEILENLSKLQFFEHIDVSNFIFNFDRKMLIKSEKLIKKDSFKVFEYEKDINDKIFGILEKYNCKSKLNFSISGGVRDESLVSIFEYDCKPNFIKTGMFTFPIMNNKSIESLKEQVLHYQCIEADLLKIIKDSLQFKNDYVVRRQDHMINYIINKLAK